jgi:ketosteroid isomerase-like protein
MSLSVKDIVAILALATRSDRCATERDAEAYVRLFTSDCTMEGDKGVVHGRDQLQEAVTGIWAAERPGTLHLTLNAVIAEEGPDPIVASVLLLLADGEAGPSFDSASVVQAVRMTPEGWLIHSRRITSRRQ